MLKKLVLGFMIFISANSALLAEANIKSCKDKCVVIQYITPDKKVKYINVSSLEKALLIIENNCFIDSLTNMKIDKLKELSCKINSIVVDLKTNTAFNSIALFNYMNLNYIR